MSQIEPKFDETMTATATQSEPLIDRSDLSVTVYTAESPLQHPILLVGEVLSDIWRWRELTWVLFLRDLKAQFRQSYLGYVWLFVPMIATTMVWMFLASMDVVRPTGPAYILLGSMIWGIFSASVSQPLNSFNASRPVFMKLKVPPEAFILSGIGRIVFEAAIKIIVLLPVLAVLNVKLASTAWLFPVGLTIAVITGLSIGFLLVPVGSLYTDVSRAIATLLSFAMYLTPVVYSPPQTGWSATIVNNNPLTAIVVTTRDWLTVGHSPYLPGLLATGGAALVILFFGLVAFRVVLPHLVERMGM